MKAFGQDLMESSKYQSKFTIKPLYGSTKEMILNRTEYKIKSSKNDLFAQDNYVLSLPSLANEELELVLKWTIVNQSRCFKLSSLNSSPFRFNGNLVFSAIISEGDIVDIGHNRLEFSRSTMINEREFSLSEKVIESDLNILLEGETGTGKSYLAKKIHKNSGRVGSFIHLNLSSFSKGLVESEIFGHVKGAFTGATQNKVGALNEANYGTLFLDEIDSLPLDIQTKLLLFLDSKAFRSVGDCKESRVDVRLIFASGRSLKELVSKGEFRKDMYYRVSSGDCVYLSPLRKDRVKLRGLLEDFQNKNSCLLSKRLFDFYMKLEWPGNIRQLNGHLEKKLILANGRKLDFDSRDEELISFFTHEKRDEDYYEYSTYKELKANYFNKVFTRVSGDYSLAAKRLDVSINTVKNVLKKAS